MGIIDDLDPSADHEYGHGFDKSVCEGCPKLNSGTISSCGICGCPLTTLSMVKGGSPPSECLRLDQHESE